MSDPPRSPNPSKDTVIDNGVVTLTEKAEQEGDFSRPAAFISLAFPPKYSTRLNKTRAICVGAHTCNFVVGSIPAVLGRRLNVSTNIFGARVTILGMSTLRQLEDLTIAVYDDRKWGKMNARSESARKVLESIAETVKHGHNLQRLNVQRYQPSPKSGWCGTMTLRYGQEKRSAHTAAAEGRRHEDYCQGPPDWQERQVVLAPLMHLRGVGEPKVTGDVPGKYAIQLEEIMSLKPGTILHAEDTPK
jgi:hypothetical protein